MIEVSGRAQLVADGGQKLLLHALDGAALGDVFAQRHRAQWPFPPIVETVRHQSHREDVAVFLDVETLAAPRLVAGLVLVVRQHHVRRLDAVGIDRRALAQQLLDGKAVLAGVGRVDVDDAAVAIGDGDAETHGLHRLGQQAQRQTIGASRQVHQVETREFAGIRMGGGRVALGRRL